MKKIICLILILIFPVLVFADRYMVELKKDGTVNKIEKFHAIKHGATALITNHRYILSESDYLAFYNTYQQDVSANFRINYQSGFLEKVVAQ